MARPKADPSTRRRFSAWLKQARVDAGYDTQTAFANELDIHLRLLQKWEGAEGLPDAQNYQLLLVTLGVTNGPLDTNGVQPQRPSLADRVAALEAAVSELRGERESAATREPEADRDGGAAEHALVARRRIERRSSRERRRAPEPPS
jgi:hypothetical protein